MDVLRRSDKGDVAVAQINQVVGGENAGAERVAGDSGPFSRGLVNEHDVQGAERFLGEGGGSGCIHQHAVYQAALECVEVLLDGDLARLAEEDGETGFRGHLLGAADYVGEEGVSEVGHDDAEGVGPALHQAARDDVRAILQLFRRAEDSLPRFGGEAGLGILAEDQRYGRLGHPGAGCDGVGGYSRDGNGAEFHSC